MDWERRVLRVMAPKVDAKGGVAGGAAPPPRLGAGGAAPGPPFGGGAGLPGGGGSLCFSPMDRVSVRFGLMRVRSVRPRRGARRGLISMLALLFACAGRRHGVLRGGPGDLDRWGRRKMMVCDTTVMHVGSLLCGRSRRMRECICGL